MGIRESATDRARRFEGNVSHMYQDSRRYVTVGVGHLINSREAAATLLMNIRITGVEGTAEEKAADFDAVSAAPAGMVASQYKGFTKLDLKNGESVRLLLTQIDQAIIDCKSRFPTFSSFPGKAQEALVDMMYNIGKTNFNAGKWPTLFAAISAKNWKDAANESNRKDVQPARNAEIKQLFLDAASEFSVRRRKGTRNSAKKQSFALSNKILNAKVAPRKMPSKRPSSLARNAKHP